MQVKGVRFCSRYHDAKELHRMSNPASSISCCAISRVSLVLQLFRQLDSWWMERGVAPTAIKLAVGISDGEMCLGDGSSSTSLSFRFLLSWVIPRYSGTAVERHRQSHGAAHRRCFFWLIRYLYVWTVVFKFWSYVFSFVLPFPDVAGFDPSRQFVFGWLFWLSRFGTWPASIVCSSWMQIPWSWATWQMGEFAAYRQQNIHSDGICCLFWAQYFYGRTWQDLTGSGFVCLGECEIHSLNKFIEIHRVISSKCTDELSSQDLVQYKTLFFLGIFHYMSIQTKHLQMV